MTDLNEWGVPAPIGLSRQTEFPVDALPPVLRDMVVARAEGLNCDPALVVGPMLPTVAAACGAAEIRLDKKGEWVEPGPIWTMTVADPASRKSAALKVALNALLAAQKDAIEEDRKTRPAKNARINRAEKTVKKAEKAYDELLDSEEEISDDEISAAETAINLAHEELAKIKAEVGSPPLVYVGTHSGAEALHDLLAEYKNLLLYVAEGDTFFRNLVQEKLDRDIFLSSWSMEDLKRNLVSREVRIAEHPSLNKGLNIQPQIVLDVLRKGGDVLSYVGLLDRYLTLVPYTGQLQVGQFDDMSDPDLLSAEAPKTPEAVAYHRMIQREVQRALPLRGEPTIWVLGKGAAEVQKHHHARWAAYQKNYSSNAKGTLGKLAGQAVRLARIFAQIEMSDTGANPFGGMVTPLSVDKVYPISSEAIQSGWTVAWHCFDNTEYMFGDALSKDAETAEFARTLIRKVRQLKDEGKASFKVRDLQNSRLRKYSADELREGLNALAGKHWLRAEPTGREGQFLYRAHPEIVTYIEKYGI